MWIAAAVVIIIIVVVAGVYYAFYSVPGPKYPVSILDDTGCASLSTACKFDPTSITVPAGNEVAWTNKGNTSHTVHTCDSANSSASQTAACPNGLNQGSAASVNVASGILTNGNVFRFTFNSAGTYNYFCNLHLWMHGTVVVT